MSEGSFSVDTVDWKDAQHLITAVRREVFILEQKVPEELEWDGQDDHALHVLARHNDMVVGTGRLLRSGQIGRMAVRREYRGHGIGTAILKTLMKLARSENISSLFLNAQLHAADFYRKHGFVRQGECFDDAGIVHCRMEYHGG